MSETEARHSAEVQVLADAPASVEEAIAALAQMLGGAEIGQRTSAESPKRAAAPVAPGSLTKLTEGAERADQVAAARYQTLIEQIPAVTFLASLTGDENELYVSPQIESLLGFTQEEWVSDPVLWYRQTHPDDRERVSINFARACATGEPFRDIIRVIARGGQTVWVHAEARLVRDGEGQPLFLQGVGFDVTEQHKAQEIRERLIGEQAERAEAERERQRKDQFLAAAAHDLKTPITAVKGLAQILQRRLSRGEELPPETINATLAQVNKSADAMTRLVNQLLDVSRLEAGTPLVLEKERADLVQLIAETLEDHRSISESHELLLESAPQELWADIDLARTERVVSNLLTNAIKYSPAGGRVTVRLMREDTAEGLRAKLQVQDEGVGIPDRDLPHIFERFRRGSNVVGHLTGTGIGLAYVQQVIADHAGTIEVESHEGSGSTFTISLPLGEGASE